jgi:hypothetical protein
MILQHRWSNSKLSSPWLQNSIMWKYLVSRLYIAPTLNHLTYYLSRNDQEYPIGQSNDHQRRYLQDKPEQASKASNIPIFQEISRILLQWACSIYRIECSSGLTASPVSDSLAKIYEDTNHGYSMLIHYDYRSRQPRYVYERFYQLSHKDNAQKQNRKGLTFFAAEEISAEHFKVRSSLLHCNELVFISKRSLTYGIQVRPKDYTDSHFDR